MGNWKTKKSKIGRIDSGFFQVFDSVTPHCCLQQMKLILEIRFENLFGKLMVFFVLKSPETDMPVVRMHAFSMYRFCQRFLPFGTAFWKSPNSVPQNLNAPGRT
jgi:hypothetical protein